MKCDELKAYSFYVTVDDDIELHAAIAELKAIVTTDNSAVIARLEEQLRKTQRALWLARAERALSEQYVISNAVLYLENKFNHKFNSVRHELHVWGVVKRKCRSKAKEYK